MGNSTGDIFVITRLFAAPRELVWKAWTEPGRLSQWLGPRGSKGISSTIDLRPGGASHYALESPEGAVIWGRMVFREVFAPSLLVFVQSFSDEHGGVTRHPMAPDWPLELIGTVTFTDREGDTVLAVQWTPLKPSETERQCFAGSHDSMRQGWGGAFDTLAEVLAKG